MQKRHALNFSKMTRTNFVTETSGENYTRRQTKTRELSCHNSALVNDNFDASVVHPSIPKGKRYNIPTKIAY
jgi:hypothetical protein